MTLPKPPSSGEADTAPSNTNNLYTIFAIMSFAIAILAIPVLACCWFAALAWGLGGTPTASLIAT